ncbi:hypothetical protein H4S07_006485, partial [Coemansia furcata]
PAAAAADKAPHDSARPSASPTATAHASRAPSPDAKAEPEPEPEAAAAASEPTHATASPPPATGDAAEPAGDAPEAVAERRQPRRGGAAAAAGPKRPASRAQRGPGLQFSSLGGSGGRAAKKGAAGGPHAVRPQSRSTVASRMEEALRGRPKPRVAAQRPLAVRTASATDGLDRMTLRSTSRLSNSLPFPPIAPTPTPTAGPGYLRATAASANRGTDAPASAATSRGTKRRNQDAPHSTTDDVAAATPKSARVGARRRSATK